MRRLIIHATDFSAASAPAFNEAIRQARTGGATLLVLHVVNPMLPPDIGKRGVSPPTYRQLRKVWRAWALEHLNRLTARAHRESSLDVDRSRGRRGDRDRSPRALAESSDDRHGHTRPVRARTRIPGQCRNARSHPGAVPGSDGARTIVVRVTARIKTLSHAEPL